MKAANFFLKTRKAGSEYLSGLGLWLLDQLFPPTCPSCYANVQAHGHICQACFHQLHVISDPKCACCGTPFAVEPLEESLCVVCLGQPPLFKKARSVWVYNAISSRIIKRLKLHDDAAMLQHFSHVMRTAIADMNTSFDIVTPVPMHWKNLLVRRYNPAMWLAEILGKRLQVTVRANILRRKKRNRHQRGLNRAARLRNLTSAFTVPAAVRSHVAGKKILLVDDVITTGATANACAKALLKAGALEVSVVTLARTLLEDI